MRARLTVSLGLAAALAGSFDVAYAKPPPSGPHLIVTSVKAVPEEHKPYHRFINGPFFVVLVKIKNTGTARMSRGGDHTGVLLSRPHGGLRFIHEDDVDLPRIGAGKTVTVEAGASVRGFNRPDRITAADAEGLCAGARQRPFQRQWIAQRPAELWQGSPSSAHPTALARDDVGHPSDLRLRKARDRRDPSVHLFGPGLTTQRRVRVRGRRPPRPQRFWHRPSVLNHRRQERQHRPRTGLPRARAGPARLPRRHDHGRDVLRPHRRATALPSRRRSARTASRSRPRHTDLGTDSKLQGSAPSVGGITFKWEIDADRRRHAQRSASATSSAARCRPRPRSGR